MRALAHDRRPTLRITLARLCRETRRALGRSQQHIADEVGVTRAHISGIERGTANPSIDVIERLVRVLGLELEIGGQRPTIIGDRRSQDRVHARCSAYVERRLVRMDWQVAREVEVRHSRSHGWIDLLAYDPRSRTLLVIEVKTRLDDVGAIERQLGWYTRSAREVAQGLDWTPRRVVPWLLALASDECDLRLRADAELMGRAFPVRAPTMLELAHGPSADWPGGRGVALIDPSSRRRDWLIRARIDGRRRPAPYRDYADAAARLWVPR
jgi:transcriptional regulator with XRE-family HTH domain